MKGGFRTSGRMAALLPAGFLQIYPYTYSFNFDPVESLWRFGIVILVVALIWSISRGVVIPVGNPPQQAATKQQEKKGTEETKYEASLHSDTDPAAYRGGAGHAWPDLRKTVTKKDGDGKVLSVEVTETIYDFAPIELGYLQGVVYKTPGMLIKKEKTGGEELGRSESAAYFTVTKEGYDAAKEWADARAGKGKNPLTPEYSVIRYNCVDFSVDLARHAGVDIGTWYAVGSVFDGIEGGLGIASSPANLTIRIKQHNCKHDWELKEIRHPGTGDGIPPPPTKIWACGKCGLTRPYGGG